MKYAFIRRPIIVFGILFALIFSAYGMMLTSTFKTMDDEKSIVKNELLRSWSGAGKLMTSSFFERNAYYRPLVSLSYLAEFQTVGLDARLYYFVNILIHTLCAWLVWMILTRLFHHPGLAWTAAVLFALHPVQWEAVSNIPGRAILMCAVFELAAFYSFILFRTTSHKRHLALSLVWFACALLSKESASVFPLVLAAYIYFIERPASPKRPNRWLALTPYIFIVAAAVLWRHHLGITQLYTWRNFPEAFLGFTTFLRGGLTFLRLLVWPSDLHFDRARAMFLNVTDPGVIMTWAAYATALVTLFFNRRRVSGPAAFFIAWTVIEFIPVSQFWVTIGVQPGYLSIAEHFLYVPSVGIFALAAMGGVRAYRYLRNRRIVTPSVLTIAGVSAVTFLWFLCCGQVVLSRTELTMMEHALRVDPDNARLQLALGMIYGKTGQTKIAKKHILASLAHDPVNLRGRISLGKVLVDEGNFWEGLAVYEQLKAEGVHDPTLEKNIINTYLYLTSRFLNMLEKEPDNASVHFTLGVIYFRQGDMARAREYFQQSVTLDPSSANGWFNLAAACEALDNREDAVNAYQKVLELPGADPTLTAQAKGRLEIIK